MSGSKRDQLKGVIRSQLSLAVGANPHVNRFFNLKTKGTNDFSGGAKLPLVISTSQGRYTEVELSYQVDPAAKKPSIDEGLIDLQTLDDLIKSSQTQMTRSWVIINEARPYGQQQLAHYCRVQDSAPTAIIETAETKKGDLIITRENYAQALEHIKAGTSIKSLADDQKRKIDERRKTLGLDY